MHFIVKMSQISFALIKYGAVINISTHHAERVSKKLKLDINKRLHIIIGFSLIIYLFSNLFIFYCIAASSAMIIKIFLVVRKKKRNMKQSHNNDIVMKSEVTKKAIVMNVIIIYAIISVTYSADLLCEWSDKRALESFLKAWLVRDRFHHNLRNLSYLQGMYSIDDNEGGEAGKRETCAASIALVAQ